MLARFAEATMSLDVGTLFVIATCVTSLLGLFLLFAWMQDRIQALAWWGVAYLIGGMFGRDLAPGRSDFAAAAVEHRRYSAVHCRRHDLERGASVPWPPGPVGRHVFRRHRLACRERCAGIRRFGGVTRRHEFAHRRRLHVPDRGRTVARAAQIACSGVGRRCSCRCCMARSFCFRWCWQASRSTAAARTVLSTGWVAVFAIEIVLYVVGAAFIVLVLAKDRTVRLYKTAAATDPLTGLFNRRGFFDGAATLMTADEIRDGARSACWRSTSIISNRSTIGLDTTWATPCWGCSRRSCARPCGRNDVIGRMGGEEFVAVISGTLPDATVAAERVRSAFEVATRAPDGHQIPATVSIGVACGSPNAAIEMLIARADAALYCAKANGRNRVETADEAVAGTPQIAAPICERCRPAGGATAARSGARSPYFALTQTRRRKRRRGERRLESLQHVAVQGRC